MGGGEPIDFYFEFSSPYGYIASQLVDDLGPGHADLDLVDQGG